jgi:hypothetical protein
MNAIEYDTSPAPRRIAAKKQGWRRMMRALRRFDHGERYSPVLCIAMLLIVGLLVKSSLVIRPTADVDLNKVKVEIPLSRNVPPDSK